MGGGRSSSSSSSSRSHSRFQKREMPTPSFWTAYTSIPIVTRSYTTMCVLTSVLVYLDVLNPLQLYFNPDLVFRHKQVWRVATCFLYLDRFGLNFMLHLLFVYRYCRSLEEISFRMKHAEFITMLLFGCCLLLVLAMFTNVIFLGNSLATMLVYVWSRRNPFVHVNLLGMITLTAPYLPWVLLCFSLLVKAPITADVIGIAVGHLYYFLEDVYPLQPGGRRILVPPHFLEYGIEILQQQQQQQQ